MRRQARLFIALAIGVIGAGTSARAQEREPPALIEMPPVHAEGEPRSVELAIEIDAEGRARAIECDAPEDLCAIVGQALREARFRPARRAGGPVASRTRLAVRVTPALREVEPAPSPPRLPPEDPPSAVLGVTAEVRRDEPGVARLELEESRDTPGALGDPFRAVLTLPGVIPMMDGLPYFYLRGAPPAGTVYVYDGIQLPALYHLAAGPAVVHPQMVGAIDVHSGVAPIEYGGHTGGVVVGEGPPERREEVFGEAEIRAIDINGFAQGRVGDVRLSAATRIGYPGLLLSLLVPNVGLVYWDYQARGSLALGRGHRLELVALGSYDQFSIAFPDETGFALTLAFHRVELRHVYQDAQTEIGLALRFGHDESSFEGVNELTPTRVGLDLTLFGTRFWIHRREGAFRLRFGGQAIGASGSLFALADDGAGNPAAAMSAFGERRRMTASLYANVEWRPLRELRVIGGVRGDLWIMQGLYEGAIDPRLRLVWEPIPALTLHAAGGVARQPAVLPIPLPGLSELPMSMGLQTAIQSEAGATARIHVDDLRLRLGGTVFVHHYDDLVSPELLSPPAPACTRQGLCRFPSPAIFRPESLAYGLEVSIRAELGRHFRGRLAYTLSETTSDPYAGEVEYTPSYDIRHVLNVVLQYDSRAGFIAGVSAFLRSGASQGFTFLSGQDLTVERYEQRLPAFARLDAMVGYGWDAGWADLRVSLEWRNVTFAVGGEPQRLLCADTTREPERPCDVQRNPAIFFPNIGLRGTFR